MKKDDVALAFFPCTMFQENNDLLFRGEGYQQANWQDEKKLKYAMDRQETLTEFYNRLCELVLVCMGKEIPLIIENPASQPHYLTSRWPIKPKIIDKDRTVNGDYYVKPTQYWFIGLEPKNNVLFEPIEYVERKTINKQKNENGLDRQVLRSMIHPQYANRFIRQYILDEGEINASNEKDTQIAGD